MTKQVLSLAALAAEIPVCWGGVLNTYFHAFDCLTAWTPDTNDGDALRLAVKLGMHVTIGANSSSAHMSCDCRCHAVAYGVKGTTPEERTRTAILLCAAKHGSQVKLASGQHCSACENHLCDGSGQYDGRPCDGIPF